MEKSTGGRLTVDSVSNIGPHYARTLREWRRRFVSRFESVIVPALKAEHPAIINGPEEGKRYRSSAENGYITSGYRRKARCIARSWFPSCEMGFTARVLGDHMIIFTREGFEGFGRDVFR